MSLPDPITDQATVDRLAARLQRAGSLVIDLEFVSEDRYVPALALVQVGWGDPAAPEVAAIDPLAVDVTPLARLVADPEVETALHAGRGDLALLAHDFGIVGCEIYDTQIAAAFLGLGDQVGYAALIEELLGLPVDKAMQFTRWLDRPLAPEQLRYALDDVRHLLPAWAELKRRLIERGRLRWAAGESARMAAEAAVRPEPEEMYLRIGGRKRLKPHQLAVLRELAAWREREALASNSPPSWLVKNGSLVDIARRRPETRSQLRAIKGIGAGTLRRHGKAILQAVEKGRRQRLTSGDDGRRPPRKLASALASHLQELCREQDVAPHLVAPRDDVDALVSWWHYGEDGEPEPDLPLFSDWRRELAGEAALDWLEENAEDGG